jgi:hypothetical protein
MTKANLPFCLCQWALAALAAAAFWMSDCQNVTPTTRSLLAEQKSGEGENSGVLQGFTQIVTAVEISGSFARLKELVPRTEDKIAIAAALYRDRWFIPCYAVAYLAMACLMAFRPGRWYLPMAGAAVALTLGTAVANYRADNAAIPVLEQLTARASDVVVLENPEASPPIPAGLEVQIASIREWTWLKWYFSFFLSMSLSALFIRTRWTLPVVTGYIFLVGGIAAAGGSWLYPPLIELGFTSQIIAGSLATLLFLFADDSVVFWEEPSTQEKTSQSGGEASAVM